MRLNGADFVAETPIYMVQDGHMVVVAAVGESCERVPVNDLERLERRGKIKRVPSLGTAGFVDFGRGVPVTLHGCTRTVKLTVKKEWTDV